MERVFTKMDITLTPDNEEFIKSQIANGIYKTIDEAINAFLNIAYKKNQAYQEKIAELNREIQAGIDAYDNGEWHDCDEVMEKLAEKYTK